MSSIKNPSFQCRNGGSGNHAITREARGYSSIRVLCVMSSHKLLAYDCQEGRAVLDGRLSSVRVFGTRGHVVADSR